LTVFILYTNNINSFIMKRHHYAGMGIFCFLILVGSMAKAQKEGKAFSVGFGLEAGAPASSNTGYNFTSGITLRFSVHAGPGFVTLGTGAVAWVPKSFAGKSTKASLQIPVTAGYKWIIAKPFFVMGELGYSSFRVYYNGGRSGVASISSGGFTYAPTVGVNFNALELGIKYESTSLSGGTISGISLRLGFNF
jgi:hypothetical protein